MSANSALRNLQGEQPDDLGNTGYKRDDAFPKKLGDIIAQMEAGKRRVFPFETWATQNRFVAGPGSMPFLRQCESAAEAFFLRPFTLRDGVQYRDEPGTSGGQPSVVAVLGALELALQVRCALSRIDAVLRTGRFRLAIEIDGLTYHRITPEQIGADYIRERRIVVAGYTLVRFTASEAFSDAEECWRQVDLIVAAHASPHAKPLVKPPTISPPAPSQ